MSREEAAQQLAAEYLQHPHIGRVFWFPSAPDDVIRLMLVFTDSPPNRHPLKLPVRVGDFQTSIATVSESGWEDVQAGSTNLWEGWDVGSAQEVGIV